ncbi:helix-turn-helix domain-containing protein [Kitasatospora sp. NBC_01266]|uniref:helix-turn-helix domain-containing protein n=1 Tax=Kitasatospora sp. NBC_01266 TaxID=2903572 RepID=UPI002E3763A9|nr:helix-turn-helix transcriptional regulator [Kitasatospora sp. NBC_01266]
MELHEDDAKLTPRTMLGRRLLRMRETSGLTLRGLAERLGFPHSYISRVEHGDQLPSEALADALDTFFGTNALFRDLLELAQENAIPDYGRVIVDGENKATRIQVFTSSLVPGLLQTEGYARALFRESIPGASEEQITAHIETRMRRKRVFAKEDPPFFWAMMDEAALRRPVGGPRVMRGQLTQLLEPPAIPHVTIQVLPFSQGAHPMLGGSLILLTLQGGTTIGYVESFASGETVELPRKILELTQMFDLARAKALPQEESLDLIRTYLKEYEHDDEP